MILIISDEDDYSTNDVIDWLIVNRKDFCRINRTDTFELKYLSNVGEKSDFVIVSSDKKIRMKLTDLTPVRANVTLVRFIIPIGYLNDKPCSR
ncbi:hypothetical protein AEM51_02350 [Bacteroidetes bacterium UKL13-3]|nr:hypothetical protein AEM51_02350 [Bacteroidetes bacterium UKL13-3]